ncbi:hypothetical protein JHK82_057142 [Glycine max]|uniref:Uncharacterized protein n=1 Tax=Glycine soja TaxID=3848 RepID=A0A445F8T0_GLYSO|nr:uncharacterized protein LOC100797094 isoform X1 [Glycine max]KAG4911134.1 hypothetical protein JHK87_057250 [Glycine soja]KAG4908488.1 hypothetical protein JHK86_056972 [Glycine max]KAG5078447.1 hypothetical protein JHK82_057142 [Glycine max]KAH1191956.1 hypothetical protein GmHk_20G059082 [Glycine max]RZB45221.1 hypothetical protein D0Y65_054856 [Glycine soja]
MVSASLQFWSWIAPTPISHRYTHKFASLTSLKLATPVSSTNTVYLPKPLVVRFALTESDSPKSIEPDPQTLLQEIADSFDLPSDYFSKLPGDLRLDVSSVQCFAVSVLSIIMQSFPLLINSKLKMLPCSESCMFLNFVKLNDAAFDLSNGPVLDECGQELGETLLNLSRAWELADTSTSHSLVKKLPLIEAKLTGYAKSALGKRLVSAGRRFQSMGQYGQGELQKIAKAMIAAGRVLTASSTSAVIVEEPKEEARVLKFGELQVEVTPDKANIGAVIGFLFGILCWQIARGVQNVPDSSLQYANDNALLLAKSLKGALLAIFYSSTFLSAFTSVGLVLLGLQLKSKKNKD